ncbi:metadherin a isoform X1 [Misgurnus anguillicaudatus]|uniref:metadherin a isoform X1 n=1 Tax=Misgurnus anguillicaudatus TaxID=75329 RepID=UPI003CCFC681
MDPDWLALATQRAEYVSDRLRGLLSSGLGFLRTELGVDLGLKPEKYPSWAILSTALIALTVLLLVAACGRRKRRAAPVSGTRSPTTASETQIKATVTPKTVKAEPSEPKKKNKKKAADKQKAQANGQTVAEPKEEIKEIKVAEEKKKTPPVAAPVPVQPPADIKAKKNKKKPKPEVKSSQDVSSTDGKEHDEAGAWETKVSQREKRQQRKKEKGPGDSPGSPDSSDRASSKVVEQPPPAATASTKKNKESSRPKSAKIEAVVAPVTSNRNDANAVNGGGWIEVPVKHQTQANTSNNEKRSVVKKAPVPKNRENSWKLESEGTLTGLDSRIKAELKPVNFTMLGLNTSGGEPGSQPKIEMCSDAVSSEWSSFNGLVDPSSDWNPPTEIWGNYEEPKVDAPVLKEVPVSKPLVESNDDKDNADPAGGSKSKRRKKKKRPEEESSATEVIQERSAPAEKSVTIKPHPPHVPKEEVSKQNIPPPSTQKKSDQNLEPQKQVQKKKARRET